MRKKMFKEEAIKVVQELGLTAPEGLLSMAAEAVRVGK
jgi:hypothetical protein